jgi:hypothetical protein
VRTGSDWCTLCYADLRPAPEVAAAPSAPATEALEPPVSAPVPAPAQLADDGAPVAVGSAPVGRGKHARRAPAGPAGPPDDVEVLANQLLAQLAVAESKNPLGPLASHLDTPGKRVGAMVGGAVGGICLLFILMTILGAVFS